MPRRGTEVRVVGRVVRLRAFEGVEVGEVEAEKEGMMAGFIWDEAELRMELACEEAELRMELALAL